MTVDESLTLIPKVFLSASRYKARAGMLAETSPCKLIGEIFVRSFGHLSFCYVPFNSRDLIYNLNLMVKHCMSDISIKGTKSDKEHILYVSLYHQRYTDFTSCQDVRKKQLTNITYLAKMY